MKKNTLLNKAFLSLIFLITSFASFSQTIISSESFNSGWGIWTAGGSNVTRVTTNLYEGTNSVRFRGTTGLALTATNINTSAYNKIDVKFFLKHSANLDENITLQYRQNATASWQSVRVYKAGNGTNIRDLNSTAYHAFYGTLFSTDFTFGATSQFRFTSVLGSSTRYFYLDFVSIIGTTYNTITTGPGGITANLETWLRADKIDGVGAISDNTNVNKWEDIGKGNDASVIDDASPTLTRRPKYKNNSTNNINFNPVVYFDNNPATEGNLDYTGLSNRSELNSTGGFSSYEQFIVVMNDNPAVVNSNSGSIDVFCAQSTTTQPYDKDGTGFGFGGLFSVRFDNEVISYCHGSTSNNGTAEPVASRGYGINQNGTGINHNTIGILSSRNNLTANGNELYLNATRIDNQEVGVPQFVNFTNGRYWLGRSQVFNGSFGGRIAEVITYTTRKNDTSERRRIESYLALKYGITLDVNGTTMNYEDSSGAIVWNSTTNAGYNYDIAGIFRDDASQHSQKQSKSINTNDDITIGLTDIATTNTSNPNTFDTDKKFLVWGNNHGTLAAQPEVKVNMSAGITPALTSEVTFISVGRTWKVVETGGNVPTSKVSIPTIMLSATLTPPGDYLMFVSSTPNFDPTAEYRIMRVNGSNLETLYDFDGTKYITFGFAPERTFERCISFDGNNDYLDAGKVLNLNTSFTVSSWIKRNNVTNRTILSKRDNGFTTGYDLSINSAGRAEMSWMNGTLQTITSTVVIPAGIWHNVAVSYDGTKSTAKLYIDGVLNITKTMNPVLANNQSFLIAAADGVNTTSYFNGGIDEVRVWNVALTDKQLRYVMNQEILSNGVNTNGKIIPNTITLNDIKIIPWSNLSAYYPMSTYTYTNAKDISNNNFTAALRNLTTVDQQTAPLPYKSANHGTWQTPATWLNNTVQDLPNSVSIANSLQNVDWNIVQTSHAVTSTGNKTVLGLMVLNNTLTASQETKIEVTNYLKLDGKIDLVGMSQLVQTLDCDLDVTSIGSIERDQQGQANKFNYNYWCSPVSPITPSAPFANNKDYSIAGIMKDGINPTPREISWIGGYDGIAGNASTALSIARYWLHTFDNKANAYANWNKITETTSIRVGLGFTMKGSGSLGKYTFVGKPNNGLINSNTVLPDQLLLTGNPYPSALDADAFINDNAGSVDRATDGTLYFWEHYSTNNTHVLKEYQGGYGVKNLVGGLAPVSTGVDFISGLGTPSKGAPNRYIPVGQGFFVNGKIGSGGTIIFNNNQRAFFIETDVTNSNSLYKTRPKTSKSDHWNNNSNDTAQKDIYKRVRLGFNSNNNYHRQVLLGFMNEKATSEMDYGYDGLSLDDIPNDMYFLNGENQLVIQGESYFDENASYPIGVKTDSQGKVSFTVDALENFDSDQKVFIYDEETETYNEIRNNAFEVTMPIGINNTRFSLQFIEKPISKVKTLGVEENNSDNKEVKITYIQNNNILIINNNISDVPVQKVTLFNVLGQAIENWGVEDKEQTNIQIPIKNMPSGIYIVKVKTSKGESSKKIIVN